MEPSFLTLLKRGKYRHGKPIIHSSIAAGDNDENEKEYQEAERFAVAALSFCLKHDPAFLKYFFDKVCRGAGDPALKHVSIEVEPHHWTDLLIRNQSAGGHYVYAVECKIDAPLAPHQNPDMDAFGEDQGYGKILSIREPTEAKIRYIVLGHRESLKLKKSHPGVRVTSRQKQWSHLESGYEPKPNETITRDLFDSLGMLGIPEFSHRKTNKMNITDSLATGADAWEILTHVHQKLGLLENRCDFYAASPKPENWEFGFAIRKKPPVQGKSENHQKLQKLVNAKSDEIGWYGYTSDAVKKRELSVWFYCDKKRNKDKLVERLQKSFPQTTTSLDEQSGAPYVVVSTTKTSAGCDRDWFISVFEAIGLATS